MQESDNILVGIAQGRAYADRFPAARECGCTDTFYLSIVSQECTMLHPLLRSSKSPTSPWSWEIDDE